MVLRPSMALEAAYASSWSNVLTMEALSRGTIISEESSGAGGPGVGGGPGSGDGKGDAGEGGSGGDGGGGDGSGGDGRGD